MVELGYQHVSLIILIAILAIIKHLSIVWTKVYYVLCII